MFDTPEKLLVAKYGTSSVTNGSGMNQGRLDSYAANLVHVESDFGLIVVSSGAVRAGAQILKQQRGQQATAPDETLASLGSPHVVTAWQTAFRWYGHLAGQILVTHHELEDTKESSKFEMSLRGSLLDGVVPIINENDVLSDKELAKIAYGGDNDGLASHVAQRMNASVLCIFTDVDGLLDGYNVVPTVGANAEDQARARHIASSDITRQSDRPSGMPYKVEAAVKAANAGIATHIANASAPIEAILAGETGTYFEPILNTSEQR